MHLWTSFFHQLHIVLLFDPLNWQHVRAIRGREKYVFGVFFHLSIKKWSFFWRFFKKIMWMITSCFITFMFVYFTVFCINKSFSYAFFPDKFALYIHLWNVKINDFIKHSIFLLLNICYYEFFFSKVLLLISRQIWLAFVPLLDSWLVVWLASPWHTK